MTVKGIDVSSYQPEDYDTAGLGFVIVKRTEGTTYANPKASAQIAHGRNAGLLVGHYHYPHIHNGGVTEADYFLTHLGSDLHPGDILVLDWEWYGQTGVSAAEADVFKDQWLAHVKAKAPGHKVGLYADRNNWRNVDVNSNCGDFLWIADYTTAGKPRIEHPWVFHQYSSTPVDKDVANFSSVADFKAWASPAPPKPSTKPKVSLSHVVFSAKHDPAASQGHTSHKAEVLLVEKALHAEGLLASQWVDGSFGSKTLAAYAAWQKKCGYTGSAADGVPGKASLDRLASKHGFTVTK